MEICEDNALTAWKSCIRHILQSKGSAGNICIVFKSDTGSPLNALRELNKWVLPQSSEIEERIFAIFDAPEAVSCIRKGADSAILRPKCNSGIVFAFFAMHGNALETTACISEADILLALPIHIFQLGILQKHIAAELKIECGNITIFMAEAEINKENMNIIKSVS